MATRHPPAFRSFIMGGFEGSSLRKPDGTQLDIIAATHHDTHAATDYRLLAQAGILTVRDALRWHLIEDTPGHYDWSSWLPMLRAANQAGIQVIWDLCHYDVPAHIDIWSPDFAPRFAAFAAAAAQVAADHAPAPRIWAPMNEISFWSWAGGVTGYMHPAGINRGPELKRALVTAAIAATRAIRAIDPAARFMQPEPLITIVPDPRTPEDAERVETYRLAQFEAWDMIAGRRDPDLGGDESLLDILGVNFYFNNQWIHLGETLSVGHRLTRPFSAMLAELHQRYDRPIIIAETGAEHPNAAGWFRFVAGEVQDAQEQGTPVHGICLYPVMDYPGWDDDRHCLCGLIALDPALTARSLRPTLLRQIGRAMPSTVPDNKPKRIASI